MITIYNKYKSIYSSEDEAHTIRGVPNLLKCKSPPDIGYGDQNTLASKPPGSVLKMLHNPRNGITLRPPVESRPGGDEIEFNTTYDSFSRESLIKTELLNGCTIPACSINRQGG